tara:strand:- start:4468 stop:5349 length:882 start_codon:yes stop_codon:yes gene_type:complete
VKKKWILLFLTFSIFSQAQVARDPDAAPLEPPYISEEEWEARQEDTQPVVKQQQPEYEVIEETDDYLKVRHPEAKNGLIKILADGTYIYKKEESKIEGYSGFKLGTQVFDNLQNNTTNQSYSDVYKTTYSLFVDFETPVFGQEGNLKWNYGLNLTYATGTGFYASGTQAYEDYSLIMLPIYGGFTYHFQYFGETQAFIPYVSLGIDAYFIYESRDDGESVKTYTGGAHANAGIRFLVDSWMGDTDDLDEDFGINHTWLVLDYKYILGAENGQTGDDVIDITSQVVTLGFGFDI